MSRAAVVALILTTGLVVGCGGTPARVGGQELGLQVVRAAEDQLGRPYRYGGAGPRGFDCSGLVQYAHGRAGVAVPRTTTQQRQRARPVQPEALRPGDLVFFRLDPPKISHVGIYAGGGRFIHAPSPGKRVSYADLDNPYWQRHLAGAGRLF